MIDEQTEPDAIEQEPEQLTETVAGMQRAEAERIATDGMRPLAAGSDLWRAGADLAGLLGEDGQVHPEKVEAAEAQAIASHPFATPAPR